MLFDYMFVYSFQKLKTMSLNYVNIINELNNLSKFIFIKFIIDKQINFLISNESYNVLFLGKIKMLFSKIHTIDM